MFQSVINCNHLNADASPPLSPGVINLYYAIIDNNTDNDNTTQQQLASVALTQDQWLKVREKTNATRLQFIKQRVMLNQVLKRHLAGLELEFQRGPVGKPSVKNSAIEFNLSHCAEIMMIAVSDANPLGLDICQHHFSAAKVKRLSQICLTSDELHRQNAPEYFYDRWALMESWLKASGVGWVKGVRELASHVFDSGNLYSYLIPLTNHDLAQLSPKKLSIALTAQQTIKQVNLIHWPIQH
ncbi:4'-phosphopantetheinyl transferase superfamily protein [Motilimonas cestriensis]|uniref:4'-phosphopantetheinyl transferase superfamily protein n=1 Tax=Motilimonas cestriensis TaxID=2742685 RepID=A0ABS8W8A4_9GAMM|nr:4'-phosphopantetheinyl transferase superfamily protein [Motilimonas cestriensis]MCE2595231.1 4'-phosphopantetheinyl transferase superfamily protein [Motilimonas cestriensis]